MTKKASNTQHALMGGASTGSRKRGDPSEHETIQRLRAWGYPQEGKREKALPAEGEVGKEAYYLADVTQEHSEESQNQRAPKGRNSLESYNRKAVSYQWPADVG